MDPAGEDPELDGLHEELIDRFGLLPEAAKVLLAVHRLRLETRRYGIARLDVGPDSASIQFVPNPPIEPMKLIKLIQTRHEYKLAGPDRVRIDRPCPGLEQRLGLVNDFLREIG